MPINLSSILFENEHAPEQETDIKKFDEDSLKKAIEKEFGVSNLQKVGSSDITNSVDTMADVAVGDVVSDDSEDIELDNQSSGTEKKESPDLIDIDSLLNIEPEIEPETLGEAPISIEDEVEELRKKGRDPKLAVQLFDKIFGPGNSQVFTPMKSKKKGFFRVRVTDEIKEDLANENDKVVSENAKQLIKNEEDSILKGYYVWKVSKGQDGAGSGTFDTWFITDSSDTDARIAVVFALGGNKGHKFEKQVGKEFKTKSGPAWQALVEYLSKPENDPAGVGVDLTTDLESFVLTNQNTKVRRPFTVKISDVGAVISDLTLKIKNRETPIYVSLKGEKGKTIANNGYPGFKVDEYTGVVTAPSLNNMVGVDSDLLNFVKAVGLNNSLIAKGLTRWINSGELKGEDPKTPQIKVEINRAQGIEALKYVTAQIGYGYIYFREKSSGSGFTIMTLKDAGDIGKLVGNFTGGKIRYPYYMQNNPGHPSKGDKSSRQCTIQLNTDKANYNVEIRKAASVSERRTDAATGLQCNMQITKIHDTPTASLVEARTRTSFNGTTSQKAPVLLSSLLWPQRLHQ